jgi:hypothetical protein
MKVKHGLFRKVAVSNSFDNICGRVKPQPEELRISYRIFSSGFIADVVKVPVTAAAGVGFYLTILFSR